MVSINIPSLNFGNQNNGNGFNLGGVSSRSFSPKVSGWVVLIVGVVIAGLGAFMIYDADHTKDWPVTTGSIQNVSSRIQRDSDGDTETKYSYSVAYTVDGRSYDESETSSSYVTTGSQVKVTYNPNDPNDVRVGNNPGWYGWIAVIVGVVAAIIGLVMLVKGTGRTKTGNLVPSSQTSSPITPAMPPTAVQNPTPAVPPISGDPTDSQVPRG